MEETENKALKKEEKPFLLNNEIKEKETSLIEAEKDKNADEPVKEDKQDNPKDELENLRLQLDELKAKYKEKENECLSAKQKEETLALLSEAGLEKEFLDVAYTPLDMAATKTKIEILKSCIEKIKKGVFQNNVNTPLPITGKTQETDPFIEGFNTARL